MSDQELAEALNHTQGIVLKRIAELEATIAEIREAARAYSKNVGHSRKCTFLMVVQQQVSGKPCICGHDALAALLEKKSAD